MSTEAQAVPGRQGRTGNSRLESLLPLLAGSDNVRMIEHRELQRDGAAFAGTGAVALLRATPQDAPRLKELGFAHVYAFHACPTAAQPRWIFPSGTSGRRALDEYVPHRLRGEFLKFWLRISLLRNRNLLVIATRQLPALERELSARLRQHAQLAFSLGTPGAYNKITATVLDGEHRVIAFAKIASLPFAQAATLQEERILRSLEDCSTISQHIPQVLASFELNGAQILVTSSGPKGRAPRKFGPCHTAFLQILGEHTTRTLRFEESMMWRNMENTFASVEGELAPAWHALLQSMLEILRRELGGALLPMGLAHGDFAPWNMRTLPDGSLYLFDWEFARPDCTPLYDVFHFEFAVRLLLLRRRWTVSNLVEYLGRIQLQKPIRASLLFLAFLTDLTLFYFLAMHRQGENQVHPDELVLIQAAFLLKTCKEWL